ncbi:OLC1v1024840C1 [Oldenlandia corymbosa var. corymbosa]|uniref:OLC1v1024840C1 n=1 Tax=Oldenlandia corymbosa var. corymbosa TaxID=529605 RepID=A0AAV1C6R2_OLDCO|nr:OLC1v1024840C1 [Oldenlandia corymbosa var. corymbosa]
MSRNLNRLRSSGSSVYQYFTMPQIRRKAAHSWSAWKDTYFSAKEIFENHKVVITVATSFASVATGWIGYTLRHLHDTRVEERLERIESGIKSKYEISDLELKKLSRSSVSIPACVATAGTTLCIGYFLGWRGGKWYSTRQFKREQMKLLGHIKPRQWPLAFLKRHQALFGTMKLRKWPLRILKRSTRTTENTAHTSENVAKGHALLNKPIQASARKTSETVAKDAAIASGQADTYI